MTQNRPFEQTEYDTRLAATRKRMAAAGLDLLVITDPANMNYISGYDGWSFYTPQCLVVALDGGQPIWIGRGIDAGGARVTTFLDADNIVPYSDDYVQAEGRHPMDYTAEVLVARGLGRGVIGLEMDSYYFSPMAYEALKAGLPEGTFKDSGQLVNWVRSIKSSAEIEMMRKAAQLVEIAMRAGIDAIEPGVRQCDAVATIYQAQIAGHPDFGGDYTSLVPMLPTGVGTSTPHLTWSDDVFVSGEATILEIAGAHRHYHCPMSRTVFLGTPPTKLTDTAKVVVEGLSAALDFAKPGVTCGEVEAVWRTTVAKYGLVKDSRIGYSTGLNYPPDWGEHTMSLRPGDDSVVQVDMTFHMIPGIWKDDWGIEISECFHVTEQGARPFCAFPRELTVKT